MDIKTIRQNKILQDFKHKYKEYKFIKKSIHIELYSRKKINLCYKTLVKPKITYYFHYLKGNDEYCLNVGKYVYNDNIELEEDLKSIEHNFKPTDHDLAAYKRFKDNYKECNFLSNIEKNKIYITKLWLNGQYKEILGAV